MENLRRKIKEEEECLARLQQAGGDDDRELVKKCHARLDDLLERHEAFWFLWSKVSEIKEADKNTKYFHHKASPRKKHNYINGLFDGAGV